MVIITHIYDNKIVHQYIYILYYHIPTFFLLSFFYNYNTLNSFNINKIKLRFERVVIPYLSWCIICWILNNFYFYIFNINRRHSLIDFYNNLLNGRIFNVSLWFQNNLIILTIIFLIIRLLFKNNYKNILIVLGILSYLLQYSGINYKFFSKNLPHDYYITYGRIAENFPHALTGFYISSINLMTILKNNIRITIFNSLFILLFITKFNVFSNIKTFLYGGIRLNIGAICLFFIFFIFPCSQAKNKLLIIYQINPSLI